jgi:DNA-directed RNA polymerase subunit RPC12/RpoP
MSKKEQESTKKYTYGPPVCKQCGTKVFLMMSKTKFKCVLCRAVKTEKK